MSMTNVIQLRHPPKPGDRVRMGTSFAHLKYTLTRIDGQVLFGVMDGHPGERCITTNYRSQKDIRVLVTTLEGKRLQ
jgi:hypothetical protein